MKQTETIEEELKRLENEHNLKRKKMELKSKIAIDEEEIGSNLELMKEDSRSKRDLKRLEHKNTRLLQTARFEKEQAEIQEESYRIKIQARQNKTTIAKGKLVKLICFVAFVSSTALTISGGIESYNKDELTTFSFLSVTLVLQCFIYISASQETIIKERFFNHLKSLTYLKYASLLISVYHSIKFYLENDTNNDLFGLPLGIPVKLTMCIVLDYITIYGTAMANDQISLNFHNKKTLDDMEKKSFDDEEIDSIIKNEMNGKGLNSGKNYDYEVVNFDGNNKKKNVVSCEIDIEDDEIYNRFLEYIEKNCKGKSKLPGQKNLAKELDTTQNVISKIENILQYKKILDIRPNGTYWV